MTLEIRLLRCERSLAVALVAGVLLLAFQGELLALWFDNYLTKGADFVPRTFHIAWELAAFVACGWILSMVAHRLRGGERPSLGMSIFATVQLAGLGACVVGVIGFVLPADWRQPAPIYSGVVMYYQGDGGMVHIGQGVERPSRGGHATFLYKHDSPELLVALADARSRREQVRVRPFVFWRTGFAAGFQPYGFDTGTQTVDGLLNHAERMALFLSVGPTVLLECLLRAVCFSGPVLLVLLASWRVVKVRSLNQSA